MQGMRSPSGGQGGGWGQPPQSNYNSRPMNRYGGGHNDMAQGYGSYQVRVYILRCCISVYCNGSGLRTL